MQSSILTSAWNHSVVQFCRAILRDLAKAAAILFSLEAVWWILRQMALTGYPESQLVYFERVHFCSSLAAFTLLCFVFVAKLAAGLYRGDK